MAPEHHTQSTPPEIEDSAALGPARSLALVRIVAGLVIASSADVHHAPQFAALEPALSAWPLGLSWLRALALPPALAHALRWLVVSSALVGVVGAYTRAAFRLNALGLLMLLALPQRLGAVTHCHHLLWVSALLAVSPCADVWSADRYFDSARLRSRGAYLAPLGFLRALVAAIYFFPGLHKLLAFLQGVAPGTWMRSQLEWKWMQAGQAPDLPLPTGELAFTALALGAVAFELSMPLLVYVRRTRLLALLFALSFHVLTAKLLFIRFESLAAILVSLLDLGPAASRGAAGLHAAWQTGWRSSKVVGGVLLIGVMITGLLGITQAYPFACYPTFAEPAPPSMPSAAVRITTSGQTCRLRPPRGNDEWVQAFRIAGAYGDPLTPLRAESYLRQRLRARSECMLAANSQIELALQQLVWDHGHERVRVLRERTVYTALASSLGSAPDEGSRPSSSPAR